MPNATPPAGENDLPSSALALVDSELARLGNIDVDIHTLSTDAGRLHIAAQVGVMKYLQGLQMRLRKQQKGS